MKFLYSLSLIVLFVSCGSEEAGETDGESGETTETTTEETEATEDPFAGEPMFMYADPQTFSDLIAEGSPTVVDVRTPEEFLAGSIGPAVNINFNSDSFEQDIQQFNKEERIYVFCQAGGRSAKAREKMMDLGFLDIVELEGGYGAWTEAGF